jgi:hypothetical protein
METLSRRRGGGGGFYFCSISTSCFLMYFDIFALKVAPSLAVLKQNNYSDEIDYVITLIV